MYLTLRFRIEHVKKLEEENNMQTITLNNDVEMPQLGFGVYQIPLEETAEAVYQAIKAGYRLIDTASIYGNEKETGEGIKHAIMKIWSLEMNFLLPLNCLFFNHQRTKLRKRLNILLK